MYSTGAITLLANKAIGIPRSLREAQLKLFPPIALGSAFLNNTPLVAMAIPVIKDITRATDLAGSKLYMPTARLHARRGIDPHRHLGQPDHRRSGVGQIRRRPQHSLLLSVPLVSRRQSSASSSS
ncbi:MAG: hypothetical protein M9896_19030 [Candidatus Promineofilum sp.]|uniref:hypothetical protein n=1 Tax=Promineifilum sp. TaxID=2664178 RepID=UPI002411EB81|nr:hypothetical protein [Promineifilum sp.]